VIAAAIAGLSSQAPAGSPLTILARDSRRSLPETIVNGQEYVALDDLASTFQLSVQEALGNVTVTYKGRTIVLTADQALASVAGRLVSLPSPSTRAGRRWLVPVEFIARALAPIYDTPLDLRKASHLLVVGDLRVPRVTIRYDAVTGGGRLTIDATPRTMSSVSQDGDRLALKFDADALDLPSPLAPALPAASLVQGIRAADATTIDIDLAPRLGGFRAATQPLDAATRLTIDLSAPQQQEQPAGPAPPPPAPTEPPPLAIPAVAVRTIAIDPGHGGMDEGVKGAGGTKEKDLVLAVARRLKASIEGRLGIRVLLTREEDRDVALEDRTSVANNNKADLFISLHANASVRPAAAGAVIYTAAFEKPGPAAAPERVAAFGGGLRDIELVPWDEAQTRFLDQSNTFAMLLQQEFDGHVPMVPQPVDRAPLAILESANMPAVLLEMGFLTNEAQEKALAGNDLQAAIVQAISDAVVKFRDQVQGGPR